MRTFASRTIRADTGIFSATRASKVAGGSSRSGAPDTDTRARARRRDQRSAPAPCNRSSTAPACAPGHGPVRRQRRRDGSGGGRTAGRRGGRGRDRSAPGRHPAMADARLGAEAAGMARTRPMAVLAAATRCRPGQPTGSVGGSGSVPPRRSWRQRSRLGRAPTTRTGRGPPPACVGAAAARRLRARRRPTRRSATSPIPTAASRPTRTLPSDAASFSAFRPPVTAPRWPCSSGGPSSARPAEAKLLRSQVSLPSSVRAESGRVKLGSVVAAAAYGAPCSLPHSPGRTMGTRRSCSSATAFAPAAPAALPLPLPAPASCSSKSMPSSRAERLGRNLLRCQLDPSLVHLRAVGRRAAERRSVRQPERLP